MNKTEDYKAAHAVFVSGHSGTSLTEVSLITSSVATGVLLRNILKGKFCGSKISIWLESLLDFIVLVLPGQLIVTLWNQSVLLLVMTSIVSALILLATIFHASNFRWQQFLDMKCSPKLNFISNYRAYTLIYTAISILAVDFVIYPRHLCKAETYGTGLMDTGVGLFIIANAVVSPEARLGHNKSLSWKKTIKSSLVLLALGGLRVIATRSVDYHEHVTEYGIHWNFFFTLAVVKLSANFLSLTVQNIPWGGLSILLGVSYQVFLSKCGGSDYILLGLDGVGGRQGFLDANREGIISSLGYISLYFYGIEIGKYFFSEKRYRVFDLVYLLTPLMALQVLLWGGLVFTTTHIQPVSRRFANLPYILWILALSTMLFLELLIVDILTYALYYHHSEEDSTESENFLKGEDKFVPLLLDSVNYNGLAYFLFSNVLTGLVNLCVKTLYQTPFISFVIISIYMIILQCITVILRTASIMIKL